MRDWFKNREVDSWINKYGSPDQNNEYPRHCISSHTEWCTINSIIYTPETILGDSIFPKTHYEVVDLELFIETIKESRHTNANPPILVSEETNK